jgi:hypothetical protein
VKELFKRDRILLGWSDERLAKAASMQYRIFDYGMPDNNVRIVIPVIEREVGRLEEHPAFIFDSRYRAINGRCNRLGFGDDRSVLACRRCRGKDRWNFNFVD